jgi:tetratricopeptide (TPR) repeat protein
MTSGGVSAARLQHPPAKKAFQAFVAAQRLSESGRFADAARELERAIEISPDYADAYSNLGAQYARLGRFEDGVSAITHAIRIGKPSPVDLSNLACAQYALRQFEDGLVSARAALLADPANVNAHYILGLLLVLDRRTLREAIPHLALAAESNRFARTALQQAQAALAAGTGSVATP